MITPVVSVVMPVYNASEFIYDSVYDVLNQSYNDLEIICVDDGSTDDSGYILDRFATKDNRIKVIHQDNRGGGAARNRGMAEAKGKYIIFLDADDRFENNLLEEAVSVAEEEKCEIVIFDADAFDYQTGQIRKAQWLITNQELSIINPFMSVNNSVWNKLFLKEFIEKKKLRFMERRAAYSTSFVANALLSANSIRIVKRVLLHYRYNNPNSNVSNEDKDPTAIVEAIRDIQKYLIEMGIYEKKYETFLYLCEKEFTTRLSFMKTHEGYRELYTAIRDICNDLFGMDSDGISLIEKGYKKLYAICRYSLDEWLLYKFDKMKNAAFSENNTYFLPYKLNDERINIALYGAGNVGMDYFVQAMRRKNIKIACWVDKDFDRIGFPVQSPNVITQIDFDLLVVAVSDRRTAESIIQSLIELGIPRNKIFFEEPEYV